MKFAAAAVFLTFSLSLHAADEIRPAAIRAHMSYLADDLLEGRSPGTRGYDLAAKYAAAALESYGLEPAGVNGFFQPVKLRLVTRDNDRSSLEITSNGKPMGLTHDVDYISGALAFAEESNVTAPIIFAGYGVSAPDYKWDDLAGIDIKGKIVAVLQGAPETFPPPVRAHFGGIEKARNLAARGAVGILTLTTPSFDKMVPWDRMLGYAAFPGMRAVRPDGTLIDTFSELRGNARLSLATSQKLLATAGRDLEKVVADLKAGKRQSFAIPAEATIHGVSKLETIESPNVAAVLRGSDPKLRDEYVVYTAHLDHMGHGAAIGNDDIYNGALDNASGSAALLEIARVFSEMNPRPKRSVMFVFVTAEERGLLGSLYYALYPTVPVKSIVANVNLDGVLMLFPTTDVVALGTEHSSLGEVVKRVASSLGFTVTPDPEPEQAYFVRSDQYSFVRQGIPAVFADAGEKSANPAINGHEVIDRWTRTIYHTPKDDMSQTFDWAAGAKIATLHMLIGKEVANATERPRWNEGDFFGKTFGAGR